MPQPTNNAPELTDEQLLAAIDARLTAAERELAELDAKRQPLLDKVERLRTTRAVYAGEQPAPRRAGARKPVSDEVRQQRAAKARERREAKRAAEAAAAAAK